MTPRVDPSGPYLVHRWYGGVRARPITGETATHWLLGGHLSPKRVLRDDPSVLVVGVSRERANALVAALRPLDLAFAQAQSDAHDECHKRCMAARDIRDAKVREIVSGSI